MMFSQVRRPLLGVSLFSAVAAFGSTQTCYNASQPLSQEELKKMVRTFLISLPMFLNENNRLVTKLLMIMYDQVWL